MNRKQAPSGAPEGAGSYIVVSDGFLFGAAVLILIFTGQGRLAVGLLFSDAFGIRLAVFRHGLPSYRLVLGPSASFLLLCP